MQNEGGCYAMDPLDFRRSQCAAAKPCNTNQSGAHSESGPNPVWEEKNKDNPGPLEGGTSEQKLSFQPVPKGMTRVPAVPNLGSCTHPQG